MPDLNETHLRNALRDLHDAALPHITAPGAEAVRRAVRRREVLRSVAAVLIAAVSLTIAALSLPGQPAPTPIDPLPSVTNSPNPSGSPTAADTGAPAASGSPSAQTGGGVGASEGPCVLKGHAKKASLMWSDEPRGVMTWIEVELTGYHRVCPGETVRAFWVTYQVQPDGSQTLYKYGEFFLSQENPRATTYIDSPSGCHGFEVFATGSYPIVQTIPAGSGNPYPVYSEQAKGGTLEFSNAYCPGVL